jgi:hypothetical protein
MSRNAQLVTEILNGVRGTNWFAHFFVPIDATAPADPAARNVQRRIEELHSKPLPIGRRSGS